MLDTWVNGGGNLIAMRPDKQLAGLLGLTDAGEHPRRGYLLVNTGAAPGAGIVGQTIQFHGTADRYTLAAARRPRSRATLYSNATTATTNPAVTLRTVGQRRQAAAFTFDLARSIVYTRQGNPAWAGRRARRRRARALGRPVLRRQGGRLQPDWVNLAKVAIPQADEQQRLLANLILKMNADRKPLPRFWYFPRGVKAVVVMAVRQSRQLRTSRPASSADEAASPAGCSVADWECIRSTVYLYTGALPDDATAKQWEDAGFEVGLHVNTNCSDWTPAASPSFYATRWRPSSSTYPSLAPLATHRTHCIAWSDWATQPKVELANGIRFDTNYYYWPPDWVNNTPGFFTGSGMPMRFADTDGTMIDVYQATTQMTDESGQTYPFTINTLLDRATRHARATTGRSSRTSTPTARPRPRRRPSSAPRRPGASPSSPRSRCSTWLDGRNGSSFQSISWNGSVLTFGVAVGAGANGLQAMVPMQGGASTWPG